MNRLALLCGVLAMTAAATFYASPLQAAETVRCESTDGRYQSCGMDTRGGVRLTRQLSSQGCWQNDTWGYDSNRIWVTNGCRAEFSVGENQSSGGNNGKVIAGVAGAALIGAAILASKNKDDDRDDSYYDNPNYGGGYNPRNVIRCESNDRRTVHCQVPRRGSVEIYRQLSSTPCQFGTTWGRNRDDIWVSGGCRADFALY